MDAHSISGRYGFIIEIDFTRHSSCGMDTLIAETGFWISKNLYEQLLQLAGDNQFLAGQYHIKHPDKAKATFFPEKAIYSAERVAVGV